MSTQYIVAYISTFSPILPFLFVRKEYWYGRYLPIVLFILASLASDVSMMLLAINGIRNMLIVHVYGLIEIVLIGYYFIQLLAKKNEIKVLVVLLIIVYIFNLFFSSIEVFNDSSRSIESILFIILSLRYYFQLYKNEVDLFFDRKLDFWIVTAILVYFSGALFSFALSKVILTSSVPWIFHNVSNIIKNVLLAIGFILSKKNK